MRVAFVAGATGYTGRAVVRALRSRGVDTVAHVRPDSPSLAAWRQRFEALGARVDTTPWDGGALTQALTLLRPDAVFALLGTTRARATRAAGQGRDEGYEAVDYGLTMRLYRAAAQCGVNPRFVYLSAAGVREQGGNAYLQVRARVERELRAGTLPWIAARPSFITGPDRDEFRAGERIGAVVIDGLLAVVGLLGGGRWRDRYRSTSNGVLAEALVRLAFDSSVVNQVVESEELRRAPA